MMDFLSRVLAPLIGACIGYAIALKLFGQPGEKAARRMTKTALDIWAAANSLHELCAEQGEKIDALEKRVRELELLIAEGEEPPARVAIHGDDGSVWYSSCCRHDYCEDIRD